MSPSRTKPLIYCLGLLCIAVAFLAFLPNNEAATEQFMVRSSIPTVGNAATALQAGNPEAAALPVGQKALAFGYLEFDWDHRTHGVPGFDAWL